MAQLLELSPDIIEPELPQQQGLLEDTTTIDRTRWAVANAAAHGIGIEVDLDSVIVLPPILTKEDERSQTGSWGDYTHEFGLPDQHTSDERTKRKFEMAQEVHKRLLEVYPILKTQFTKGVEQGISEGYIPEYVHKRLRPLFSLSPTTVFASWARARRGTVKAFYDDYDNGMYIPSNLSKRMIMRKLPHEWIHQISGGAFIKKTAAFANVRRTRIGFGLAKQEEGDYTNRYLTDTITEHLNVGVMRGDFDTIDPDARRKDQGSYRNMRKMFGIFCDRSGGIVQLKTACRASFEDNVGPDATYKDRWAMVRQFTTAYEASEHDGKMYGVRNSLDRLLEAVEDDTAFDNKPGKFEDYASCIVAPELDEQGNVIKKGRIDRARLEKLIKVHNNARTS